MPISMEIGKNDGIVAIEAEITKLELLFASADKLIDDTFCAKLSSDRRASFFKDIWTSIAIAGGIDRCARADITAWGIQDWSKCSDEEGFALSYPSLLAIQRRARVLTEKQPQTPLDEEAIRRHISQIGGVIGTGGRQRTLVELDPHYPVAAALGIGAHHRDMFFEFVRKVLANLEIGAAARKGARQESRAKGTILAFLYELHANAFEHGRANNGVRLLRLQKHQFPHRDGTLPYAKSFEELEAYLRAQPEKPSSNQFNLVEASVSDFGPGILDGFLSTFAGRGFYARPRASLLDSLVHEQLSCKSDPNAGLGIGQALAAASDMDAFVSLRTGEFWLTMRGKLDASARLTFRKGRFPRIIGTHWQLLLPDRTSDRSPT